MPGLSCATVQAMPCISICAPYIQAESSCDASRLHAAHVFMRITQPRYNYPPEIADGAPSGLFFPHILTRRHNNIWTAAPLPQNNRLALLTPRFCRHCFATGQFHTHLARQPPILHVTVLCISPNACCQAQQNLRSVNPRCRLNGTSP